MSETINHPSFLDRMKDAALAQMQERQVEYGRIGRLVLGDNDRRRRVTDMVKLGDDYIVEVTNGADVTWTTVVNGETSSWHHERQEDAILHLIARRYDSNPNSNHAAAFYAGRVLGVPTV